jgi:hypothetical protein
VRFNSKKIKKNVISNRKDINKKFYSSLKLEKVKKLLIFFSPLETKFLTISKRPFRRSLDLSRFIFFISISVAGLKFFLSKTLKKMVAGGGHQFKNDG